MTVLSCQQLIKYHGANLVLADVTFELAAGDRAGLIGRNGTGKTTLLQIIAGLEGQDGGDLFIQKRTRIGYLPQIPVEHAEKSVRSVLELGCQELLECRAQMTQLESRMAHAAGRELDQMLKLYADLQERFQREGGYELDARIDQVAQGLGVTPDWYGRAYASLSGGEKTRVGLASLLIEEPTLLLLDEPTNHLDTAGIEWLESYLTTYPHACLIVSHDRYFLDRVVTRIVELEDGESALYLTNYSGYVKEKEERLLQQFAQYQEQQKRIKQMKETIAQLQEWGRIGDNGKFFRRAASMQKALDRMEKIKRPILERRAVEFDLQQSDRSGREVLTIEGMTKRYGPKTILDGAEGRLYYGQKVAIVGENGAGKSTLLRLILGQEQPDAGAATLGARVEVGYLAQEEQPPEGKSLLEAFCEEARVESGEGRGLLARYLFYGSDVFKPLHLLSGGEWTRFRLALLMYRKPNLLLLDEPTNHLDIAAREALEEALDEFPGTVLAISHDRYFINRIAQRVWEVGAGRLTAYLGNYDEYRAEREKRLGPARDDGARGAGPRAAGTQGPAPEKAIPRREERARAELEAAIHAEEGGLAGLDRALAEAHADAGRLAELWPERQAAQERLDRLYALWLEVEESKAAPESGEM